MASTIPKLRRGARFALAGIRLFNGSAALFAPAKLGSRLSAEPASPEALYALRLFGVRTIYVAGELLLPDGPHRRLAMRVAPVIHLSDTMAAIRLPKPYRRTATAISALNSVLALIVASEPEPRRRHRRPWKR